MMKSARFWAVLAGFGFVILSAGTASAQKAPAAPAPAAPIVRPLPPRGTEMVFIDQAEIEQGAAAFKGLLAQRDKMLGTLQVEVGQKEKALRAADDELNKQRNVLAPDAYSQKRRELDNRYQQDQQLIQNHRRDIDQSIGDAYNKVMKQVFEIVADMVKENDYKVVLERKVLVMAQSSLDISGEVISRLNKRMPSVTAAVPK
jgi:outer membrane protein